MQIYRKDVKKLTEYRNQVTKYKSVFSQETDLYTYTTYLCSVASDFLCNGGFQYSIFFTLTYVSDKLANCKAIQVFGSDFIDYTHGITY